MADFEQDDEWQPPTESEMKVLEARRERQDKISKLMGDYLLKGWRMLGICCPVCDTILLQDKQGSNYCVACRELDADNVKDDPALSDEAALRQAAEHNQKTSTSSSKNTSPAEDSMPAGASASTAEAATLPSTTAGDIPHQPSHVTEVSLPHDTTHVLAQHPSHGNHPRSTGDHSNHPRSTGDHSNQGKLHLTSPDLTRHVPRPPIELSSRPHSDIPIQESFGSVRPRMFDPSRHHAARHMPYNTSCGLPSHGPNPLAVTHQALDTLYSKLQAVTMEIQQATDVSRITDLCSVVKTLAEAIEALHKAKAAMH